MHTYIYARPPPLSRVFLGFPLIFILACFWISWILHKTFVQNDIQIETKKPLALKRPRVDANMGLPRPRFVGARDPDGQAGYRWLNGLIWREREQEG